MPVRLQISGPGVGCGRCHENSMSLSAEPTHCIYLFNGLGCFRERGRKFPASLSGLLIHWDVCLALLRRFRGNGQLFSESQLCRGQRSGIRNGRRVEEHGKTTQRGRRYSFIRRQVHKFILWLLLFCLLLSIKVSILDLCCCRSSLCTGERTWLSDRTNSLHLEGIKYTPLDKLPHLDEM